MKKYAICEELIGMKCTQFLLPWIKYGTPTFKKVSDVPKDLILISLHYPPWREPFKSWINEGNNYLEIEFGYWGNNEGRRDSRRITYNGHHNLNIKTPPYSRIKTLTPGVEEWKTTKSEYVLVVDPNPTTLYERRGITLDAWREEILEKITPYWKGDVRWRTKVGGKNKTRWPTFLEDLSGCHAVVGERTMACAEAVILGYPAYTTDYSIVSLLMGQDLSSLSNPTLPNRSRWLEHLAWSQFYPEEFQDGIKVINLVEKYQIIN